MRGCSWRGLGLFRGAFGGRQFLEMLAHQFRMPHVNGAGMRFLFGNANFREIVQHRLGFYFQFARQFIDADLICVSHQFCFSSP